MPRRARLRLAGMPLHIVQRGNNRTACFFNEQDYRFYLGNLQSLAASLGCAVHAYVLMTNHVHLLATPANAGAVTGLMRDLGQRYVQYFNGRHERSGTLWEGRFRSCIAESARYVLACYRYIELNPVRARMVDYPSGYIWSSYAINSGMRSDPFIAPHSEYTALASEAESRFMAYRRLFDGNLDPALQQAIRDSTNSGYPLASDGFKATVLAPLGWKLEPGKPGPRALSPEAVYVVMAEFGL